MSVRLLSALLPLLSVCGAGCESRPVEAAPGASLPAVNIPVGPVPGPGDHGRFATNPYSKEVAAIGEGRRLFVWYNCAGCHGGRAGGGMGPSLRDESWIYGDSDAHIFDSIAEGRAHGMPAWGVKIPEEQIWKLVAYINSLRTELEPNPPPQEAS